MASANTAPIFTITPNIGLMRVTAQQTGSGKSDGAGTVGTDIFLAFSSGVNGSYIKEVRIKPAATTAATTTTATSIRVYLSSINSGSTTSSNTKLLGDIAIPAVSAGNTTTPIPDFLLGFNFAIPTAMYLLVGSGNSLAANTEFHITTIGGDY